jgi:hypothetical protein
MIGQGCRTRRSPLPAGLLGMAVLVALVEWSVARHALDFTRFYIHDWRVAGRAARDEASRCEVVCFGDSLVKFGIVPRVLEERLGRKAYNLAVCDGQAASSYFLLRRILEAKAKPSAVVVDFVPHLLATDPRHNLRQWPEMIDAREGIDLGYATKHAGFFASLTLGGVFPSVKDRYEIRGNIAAALRGASGSHRDEIPRYERAWERERGAIVSAERPSYRGEVDTANPAYFPRNWRCHPVNNAYVQRFLALAAEHSVEVFWLLPPVAPKFQARRDEAGLEASYDRYVRAIQDRHPELIVIDARRAGYDHSLFIDPLHLNGRGASALSIDVADVIVRSRERRGSGTRWVHLPSVRGRSLPRPDDGLELPAVAMQTINLP